MNRLGNITFYVEDVAKTISFYERAFGVEKMFIDPTGQYGQLETGHTALAFASLELAQQNLSKAFSPVSKNVLPGCEISFTAKNIHQSLEKALQEGCELIAPPVLKPWGQTTAYVRDFNGILIEICTEMAHIEEEDSCGHCCSH